MNDGEHEMLDEEFWDVVVIEATAEEDQMITMTEATFASIVGSISGFKDYAIVPIKEYHEGDPLDA